MSTQQNPSPPDFNTTRRQNRAQQAEDKAWIAVEESFYRTEQFGSMTHKAYYEWQQALTLLDDERQENEEFACATPQQIVQHCRFGLFLLASYFISLILIFDATEYLVSLVARDNGLVRIIGILLVPLAIIVMQSALGIDVYLAERDELNSLIAKRRTAQVAVFITPALILGTFLAGGNGFWPPALLLLAVRMALAYITDAYVVHNGEQAYDAKAYLAFTLKYWRLNREQQQLKQTKEGSAAEAVHHFQECQQKLAAFQRKYPESSHTLPPFSNPAQWTLDQLMSSESALK